MKTAIVGPGALGTLLAAYLARGGADVVLVGRPGGRKGPESVQIEIQKFSGESFKVSLARTNEPARLKDVDLIILCVKTYHSEEALSALFHLRDRVRAVLSFQNGVEKERLLEKYFGRDKVLGGCCAEAATRRDETTVLHTMSLLTYIGEPDGSVTPRVKAVVRLLTAGGLKAEASAEVVSVEWCKWINFAAISGVCALTRLPYYRNLLNPHSADLIAQIYREYAELAAASGVEVKDYPGFEVRTLSRASRQEAVRLLRQRGEDLLARGATGIMPSLARDLMAGRPTERESIFGFAVREGEARNLAMTFTRHAYALITAIEQGAG
jgi:2-dehydropantoate 2-reductase